ncbi:MAG: SDR family oxidoreductase [Actinomycetota bacterium]|nr:SDR family oxidoreductase [Actinomycetota bacterium]
MRRTLSRRRSARRGRRPDAASLESLAAGEPDRVDAVTIDVTDPAAARLLVDRALERFGRLTAFGAAKAGVQSLIKGLALEYGALGVRANAIAPGPIESPGILAWLATRPGGVDEHVKDHPMRRMGKPEEIAAAAAFLASDDASYINGITIPVDGGKQATL